MIHLALALVLASAPAESAARWFELPGLLSSLEASPVVPLAEVSQLGRQPAALSFFTTSRPAEEVAAAFHESWARLGLPVLRTASEDGVTASAFLTREGLQLAAVARRQGGRTICFLAAVSLAAMSAAARPRPTSDLPGPLSAPRLFAVTGTASELTATLERAAAREGLQAVRTQVLPGATVLEHRSAARAVFTVLVPAEGHHWLWQVEERAP